MRYEKPSEPRKIGLVDTSWPVEGNIQVGSENLKQLPGHDYLLDSYNQA